MNKPHPVRSGADPEVTVWALSTRIGHWALAFSVLTCLLGPEGGDVHEWLGYAALALALWRVVVGLGSRQPQLRFSRFVQGPSATLAYTRALLARREPRHLGHNPLGGWMILALLAGAIGAGATGALYVTDAFWGAEWLEELHEALGEGMFILVALHVGGVVLTSLLQRENLIKAMWHGRKAAPAPGDVGPEGP